MHPEKKKPEKLPYQPKEEKRESKKIKTWIYQLLLKNPQRRRESKRDALTRAQISSRDSNLRGMEGACDVILRRRRAGLLRKIPT